MVTAASVVMISFIDFVAYMGAGEEWLPIFMIEDDKQKEQKHKWMLSGYGITMSDLENQAQIALDLMEQHKAGIFIYPNGATSDRYVQAINWHFVDIDGGSKRDIWLRIINAPLQPTFVYRGRAGFKLLYRVTDAYWDTSTPEALKQSIAHFKNVQQQLNEYFGGDASVVNPSHALRPPFVKNFKYWWKRIYVEELVRFQPENEYPQQLIIEKFPPATKRHKPEPIYELYTPEDLEPLLQEVCDCLDASGLEWKDYGERIALQCPFHDDTSPSAYMYKSTLMLHCSAGANGTCTVDSGIRLREAASQIDGWENISEMIDNLDATKEQKYETISLESMSAASEIPLSVSLNEYSAKVGGVTEIIEDKMRGRGQMPDVLTDSILRSLSYYALSPQNKALCVPLPPGGGKTTWKYSFLEYLLQNDLEGAGTVIVVERIDQARDIARSLGKYQILRQGKGIDLSFWEPRPAAYVMESAFTSKYCVKRPQEYRYGICRGCPEQRNCPTFGKYTEQQKHPIVILSHARLAMDGDKLEKYSAWIDANGKRHHRRLIIIDEKPPILQFRPISLSSVQHVEGQLRQMAAQIDLHLHSVLQPLEKVKDLFSVPHSENSRVEPINPDFRFDVKSVWYRHYHEDQVELLEWVELLIREGGFYNSGVDKEGNITVAKVNSLHYENYTTIILDGTGAIDMEYRAFSNINFLEIPRNARVYSNLTFHVLNRSLGKLAIWKQPEILDVIIDQIKHLARNDKTFVLCYKEHKARLIEALSSEMAAGMVMLNHFGNVKGANTYNSCTAMVILGSYHKGEPYYLAKYKPIFGRFPRTTVNPINRVRRLHEVGAEMLKLNDQLVTIIQDVCRVAIRNRSYLGKVKVFIPSQDKILVNLLAQYFCGCEVKEWSVNNLESIMPEWYGKLDHFMAELSSGDEVTKQEIRLSGGVKDRNFRNVIQTDMFRELLEKHGIDVVNSKKYRKA